MAQPLVDTNHDSGMRTLSSLMRTTTACVDLVPLSIHLIARYKLALTASAVHPCQQVLQKKIELLVRTIASLRELTLTCCHDEHTETCSSCSKTAAKS